MVTRPFLPVSFAIALALSLAVGCNVKAKAQPIERKTFGYWEHTLLDIGTGYACVATTWFNDVRGYISIMHVEGERSFALVVASEQYRGVPDQVVAIEVHAGQTRWTATGYFDENGTAMIFDDLSSEFITDVAYMPYMTVRIFGPIGGPTVFNTDLTGSRRAIESLVDCAERITGR